MFLMLVFELLLQEKALVMAKVMKSEIKMTSAMKMMSAAVMISAAVMMSAMAHLFIWSAHSLPFLPQGVDHTHCGDQIKRGLGIFGQYFELRGMKNAYV